MDENASSVRDMLIEYFRYREYSNQDFKQYCSRYALNFDQKAIIEVVGKDVDSIASFLFEN